RKGMTMDEIEEMLLQDDLFIEDEEENVDVVIIPPHVDELTDDENIDEDDRGSPQVTDTHVAVDEMMVKYYGRNSLKQFIRGKPIRFGYKLWALCGPSGYCYNFDLYCGKQASANRTSFPLGFRVVIDMLSIMKNPEQHCVYFANF
ncbi:PiggyBac transposable element-derived protein, partial [Trinorchestia longiramus]